MNEQIASALRILGTVSVDTVAPAFDTASLHIARGSITKANPDAVARFKHPILPFSFTREGENAYSFHVYFNPSDLTTPSVSSTTDKPAK